MIKDGNLLKETGEAGTKENTTGVNANKDDDPLQILGMEQRKEGWWGGRDTAEVFWSME